MPFHVECRCGNQMTVVAEDAGTTVRCECGESVKVPSLSKLRTGAGLGSYESGAIDTIRRMIGEGTLPWGTTCAVSGRPTRDLIHVHVQCERLHVPKDHQKSMIVATLIFGVLGALLLATRKQEHALGRDTTIEVPLHVHREYHSALSKWWMKRKLRRLLRTVPVYARLLDEYPKATIAVAGTLAKFDDPDF